MAHTKRPATGLEIELYNVLVALHEYADTSVPYYGRENTMTADLAARADTAIFAFRNTVITGADDEN